MSLPPLTSTKGKPIRERWAGGFRFLEVVHDAHLVLTPHSHEHASLCCVLRGGFQEWMDGVHFEPGPLDLLVEPRGVPHRSAFGSEPTSSLIIEVESPSLDARLREVGPLLGSPGLLRSARLSSLGRILHTEFQLEDDAATLAMEGLALELVAAASRFCDEARCRFTPPWLARVAEQVRSGFRTRLELDWLAREAGVHPVHLARTFRKHYGESIGAHVRRLRVHWCADRLCKTKDSLASIAAQAGFCDQSHMARSFKHVFGCSPSHYRRLRRGG